MYLLKTDAAGTASWWKPYGHTDHVALDFASGIAKTPTDGYVLTGQYDKGSTANAGNYQGWIVVTDGDGTQIDCYTWGGPRTLTFSVITSGGGYVAAGESGSSTFLGKFA